MTRALLSAALVLSLSACSLAPYKPAPGEPTAVINVKNVPGPSICTDKGRRYSLVPDRNNEAKIPANERLTLYSFVYIAGYNVSWSCMPGIGFTPEAGKAYYGTVESENQRCRYELYRAGADNRIGLDFEPTIAPPHCPAPR